MASKRGSVRGKATEVEKSVSPSDEPVVTLSITEQALILANPEMRKELLTEKFVSNVISNNPLLQHTTQDSSNAPTETTTKTSAAISTVKDRTKMADEPTSLMEFSSDLNDAEAPPPIPVGEYPATIVKAEIKNSAAGNKYLALMFRIDPESYPADFEDGNPEGETLPYNRLVLQDTPQGRWRAKRFNESVGAPLSRVIDPNEYMGLTANVGITHDTWEGDKRAQIAKVLAA